MKFLVLAFSFCFLIVVSVEAKKRPKRYNAVVYLTDNSRFNGILEKVSADGLTIDYYGSSKFINSKTIDRIRIKRVGTLTRSMVIGAAGGLLAGYGIYEKAESRGTIQSQAWPVVIVGTALLSGGVVALINSFIPKEDYKNLQTPGEYKKIISELSVYTSAKL